MIVYFRLREEKYPIEAARTEQLNRKYPHQKLKAAYDQLQK